MAPILSSLSNIPIIGEWAVLDFIIAILLVAGFINGMRRGFVTSLTSFAAILLGVSGAIAFSYFTTDLLGAYLEMDETSLKVIAIVLSFILIYSLIKLLGRFFKEVIQFIALGGVDRLIGGVLGFLKSFIVICFVIVLFSFLNGQEGRIFDDKYLASSSLYPTLADFGKKIIPIVNDQIDLLSEEISN